MKRDSTSNAAADASGKEEAAEKAKEDQETERYKIKVSDQSSMRRQISFAIFALKDNKAVTISAFGLNVEKAVRMAEIIKLRLGMLHQENNLIISSKKM